MSDVDMLRRILVSGGKKIHWSEHDVLKIAKRLGVKNYDESTQSIPLHVEEVRPGSETRATIYRKT